MVLSVLKYSQVALQFLHLPTSHFANMEPGDLHSKHFLLLEVCHPRYVCENWKGHVVEHNSVN